MPIKTTPPNESAAEPQTKLALNREEAANALSVSVATLDRLTKRRLIRPSRAMRRPVYPIFELKRFLKETQGKAPRGGTTP